MRVDAAATHPDQRSKEPTIKKLIALPLVLAASIGLAACSQNAQNEAAEAVDATATDLNNAAGEAVADIDAATSDAQNSAAEAADAAGDALDNAGARLDAQADRAASATANRLDAAGDSVRNEAR